MQDKKPLAVLFADVAGSTRLYEMLGNVEARDIIMCCVSTMTEVTHGHGGTLVKTIGDEIMSTFGNAAEAAAAACEMQLRITGLAVELGLSLAIRIGFHFGPILLEGGDVFGDTVNLAAHMTSKAKAGQILTTGATVAQQPNPAIGTYRQIDITRTKGKLEEILIYELVWQAEDATIMRAPRTARQLHGARLLLVAGETTVEVGEGAPLITLGRSEQNDLRLDDSFVSRMHARIDYRNGRFVLSDLSANGTYVLVDGGSPVHVHRDSWVLTDSGKLGLGRANLLNPLTTVRYDRG